MARAFAQIKIAIWKDDDYKALTMAEQWLYEALISQPDLTMCGVIIHRPARWSRLCKDVTLDDVNALLRQLEAKRYLVIDWDTEEVLIRTFVKHDGGNGNWKIRKGIDSAITRIESDQLRAVAQAQFDALPPLKTKGDGSSTDRQSVPDGSTIDEEPDQLSPTNLHLPPDTYHPSTSNQQPPTALPPAAAAAVEILVEHRITTEPNVRDVTRYGDKIRADTYLVASDTLERAANRGDDSRQIAVNVLGLTRTQAATAAASLRRKTAVEIKGIRADCPHCNGEGLVKDSDERWHTCECEQTALLATVHELPGRTA